MPAMRTTRQQLGAGEPGDQPGANGDDGGRIPSPGIGGAAGGHHRDGETVPQACPFPRGRSLHQWNHNAGQRGAECGRNGYDQSDTCADSTRFWRRTGAMPTTASSTSAALALTVGQATTQTSVTAVPNPTAYGTTVTFTAKVAGNGGIPSGTVTSARTERRLE